MRTNNKQKLQKKTNKITLYNLQNRQQHLNNTTDQSKEEDEEG